MGRHLDHVILAVVAMAVYYRGVRCEYARTFKTTTRLSVVETNSGLAVSSPTLGSKTWTWKKQPHTRTHAMETSGISHGGHGKVDLVSPSSITRTARERHGVRGNIADSHLLMPVAGPYRLDLPPSTSVAGPHRQATEDFKQAVAAVVSRQRGTMLYWMLLVGGAGLGAIILLSLLTIGYHKLRRQSQSVHMRHKHSERSWECEPQPAGTIAKQTTSTAIWDVKNNYSNVNLTPTQPRVVNSTFSWGSEFDVASDQTENIYSNNCKKTLHENSKKPTSGSIYINSALT